MAAARSLCWASRAASFLRVNVPAGASPLEHLGDVVFVELPEVGAQVSKGASFGAVESVKATSDVYTPVSGKVVEVNQELLQSPGLINGSPYENGWLIKLELSDSNEVNSLMDSDQYEKFCKEEDAKH